MSEKDTSEIIEEIQHKNSNLELDLERATQALENIQNSRSYAIFHKMQTIKTGFKSSPKAYSKKVAKKILTDPSFIIRKLRGKAYGSTIMIDPKMQYQKWIQQNEPSQVQLEKQKKKSRKLEYKPTISIITPVFNPPADIFEELILSVTSQTYPYWELCLGEFGGDKKIQEIIKKYSEIDSRIKYKIYSENLGISENSNNCLKLATGEYIALLDHDDTISPDALYENALLLNKEKLDFIYSDKDKLSEAGERFDPLFKPEWSPHLMYSANYLTHFNVMRKKLVEKVGGWDPTTDGAQDWDIFFKITEKTNKIGHISKVLYHWRILSTSTSLSIETKPYALQGQINALNYHLGRVGEKGEAYHTDKLMLAVRWPKNLSSNIFIIQASSSGEGQGIVESIQKNNPIDAVFHILIDSLNTGELGDKNITVHSLPKHAFTKLIEAILKSSKASLVYFINEKAKFSRGFFDDISGWALQKDIAFVAPLAFDKNKRFIGSMEIFGLGGTSGKVFFGASEEVNDGPFGSPYWYRDTTLLSTSFLCIERKKILENFTMPTEDFQFNLQQSMILAGNKYSNLLDAQASVVINELPQLIPPNQHRLKIAEKNKSLCTKGDPFFNKNFSLQYLTPHLAISSDINEYLPLDSNKMFNNFFLKGIQNNISVDKLNEIKLIEKYDAALSVPPRKTKSNIANISWFLVGFDSVYAGLNNVFTLASYLSRQHGVVSTFYIDTEKGIVKETALIQSYPDLVDSKVILYENNTDSLPITDLAIATLWTTAYFVSSYSAAKRKAYFIQDDETLFYTPGSTTALVEASYQLGLLGITNTLGLERMYIDKYKGSAITLKSSLNLSKYLSTDIKFKPNKPYLVFFYARPGHPRNGFELGIAALKKLKQYFGDDIRIVTAGADWDPSLYGIQGVVSNLGKLSIEQLPDFYKQLDASLFLMFSKHPGVVPSELMASGCPVVVNSSTDETWNSLYKNNETAIVCLPTATEIFEGLKKALTDTELREKIISNARQTAVNYYTDYEKDADVLLNKIEKNEY